MFAQTLPLNLTFNLYYLLVSRELLFTHFLDLCRVLTHTHTLGKFQKLLQETRRGETQSYLL